MRDISDKEMAEICDAVENTLSKALTPLYNQLAEQYTFPRTNSDDMYDEGMDTGKLPEMRELAIQLFYHLGMNVQGDGKGF